MKFSIVTPSCNSVRFIRETMLSVITQTGDFTIQYIIFDNCSNDGTVEIIADYQGKLQRGEFPIACKGVELIFKSEADRGMYDAINKGFALTDGDVMAWINADDIYLPGAFSTIAAVLSEYEDVHWVKGITSYITEDSSICRIGQCHLYSRDWIMRGAYGRDEHFIQQDSVFWRAWLWKETGGIKAGIKLAGDYFLWLNFAKLAPLVSVRSIVSCFRHVDGQLSQDSGAYQKEAAELSPGNDGHARKIRLFLKFGHHLGQRLKRLLFRMLFGRQEYSAILIDRDGSLQKITGQRFEVTSRL